MSHQIPTKLRKQVYERANGVCELCGGTNMLQPHHILFGVGKRKACERFETLILLDWDCHYGTFGVHGREGHALDMKLKLGLQLIYFEQGCTNEETRKLMGDELYFEE